MFYQVCLAPQWECLDLDDLDLDPNDLDLPTIKNMYSWFGDDRQNMLNSHQVCTKHNY